MGRKRIHPTTPSLDERLGFDDPIWDKPDLEDEISPSLRMSNNFFLSDPNRNGCKYKWESGIIYKIQCLANNREYVGQTTTYVTCNDDPMQLKRIIQHFQALKKGNHEKSSMQRDWTKFGEARFTSHVLEVYDERLFSSNSSFKSFLNQREVEVMFELNSLYNSQIQSTFLLKVALSKGLKYKSDLVEAISLGEVVSVEIPQEKVYIEEYSKDFYPSMKYLLPGLEKK